MVYEVLRKPLNFVDKMHRDSLCYLYNYYSGSNFCHRNYYSSGDVRAFKLRTKSILLIWFRVTATTSIISSYVSTVLSTVTYATYSGITHASPFIAEQLLTKRQALQL